MVGTRDDILSGVHMVLKEGTTEWELKTVASLRTSRQKFLSATSLGPTITYGVGDNTLDATIIATTPQISTIYAYIEKDSSTDQLPNKSWKLECEPLDGGTKVTISFKAEVSEIVLRQEAPDGKCVFDIHMDITEDTVTVA